MSFLVLHMDKFKKEAVRGIQSHNSRERESHSNPDIDYERSGHNYDLHEHAAPDYAGAVQNRIDDLLLVKAVRHDAVHMCGLIVSSDREFFWKIGPEETRRFFEESKAFLTEFVGAENVISAMVHMDEKTPHMHFLHVPVTSDGRLNANKIYTRESLKKLQTDLPAFLHSKGFELQRGVEQVPGAKKKHLDTREFKQQREALNGLQEETATLVKSALTLCGELEAGKQKETALRERLQSYEEQAQEAEKVLRDDTALPDASMFSFKPALEKARDIIEQQKKALASKHLLAVHNEKLQTEIHSLQETVTALNKKIVHLETEKAEERERSGINIRSLSSTNQNLATRLEETEKFFRWNPSASLMRNEYEREQRQEAQRKAAEQKQKTLEREQQERQQQEECVRQAREQEQQKAQELERQQRERENSLARQWPSPSRGMGMGR